MTLCISSVLTLRTSLDLQRVEFCHAWPPSSFPESSHDLETILGIYTVTGSKDHLILIVETYILNQKCSISFVCLLFLGFYAVTVSAFYHCLVAPASSSVYVTCIYCNVTLTATQQRVWCYGNTQYSVSGKKDTKMFSVISFTKLVRF